MGKENLPQCVRKFKEVYSEVFAMSKFCMRSFISEVRGRGKGGKGEVV